MSADSLSSPWEEIDEAASEALFTPLRSLGSESRPNSSLDRSPSGRAAEPTPSPAEKARAAGLQSNGTPDSPRQPVFGSPNTSNRQSWGTSALATKDVDLAASYDRTRQPRHSDDNIQRMLSPADSPRQPVIGSPNTSNRQSWGTPALATKDDNGQRMLSTTPADSPVIGSPNASNRQSWGTPALATKDVDLAASTRQPEHADDTSQRMLSVTPLHFDNPDASMRQSWGAATLATAMGSTQKDAGPGFSPGAPPSTPDGNRALLSASPPSADNSDTGSWGAATLATAMEHTRKGDDPESPIKGRTDPRGGAGDNDHPLLPAAPPPAVKRRPPAAAPRRFRAPTSADETTPLVPPQPERRWCCCIPVGFAP
ncbi:hypothetical protein DIPPA_17997 [Diplonema papillatum]|nr:hypothetical protein DIPPA_17997 [Diplonema papillatum]